MNPNKPIVVARLTAMREIGIKTIIEVHADATFSAFYHFFKQEGNRWSTKAEVRTANRNEALPYINAHTYVPGLERIAERFLTMPQFKSVKVRIIKKRLYKRLVNASASDLGCAKVGMPIVNAHKPTAYPRLIGKAIPSRNWKWPEAMKVKSLENAQ